MSVTLKSISDQVGLSSMTISRVLRGVGNVKPDTRKRILQVADELGYPRQQGVVFPTAVRTRSSSHQLRLLLPYLGSYTRNDADRVLVDGIEERLSPSGGKIILQGIEAWDEILPKAREERVHSIILRKHAPQEFLDEWQRHFQVIYATSHDFQPGVDSVYANENRSAAALLELLLRQGHRQLAFFGILDVNEPHPSLGSVKPSSLLPEQITSSIHNARYASWAYIAQLKDPRFTIRILLEERDWRRHSLEEVMDRLVARILRQAKPPTAIISAADVLSIILIRKLKENGLSVPGDISICSYGGLPPAAEHTPPLTTVEIPFRAIGRCLPELVERRLAQPDALPVSLQLETAIQAGGTVGPVPKR